MDYKMFLNILNYIKLGIYNQKCHPSLENKTSIILK